MASGHFYEHRDDLVEEPMPPPSRPVAAPKKRKRISTASADSSNFELSSVPQSTESGELQRVSRWLNDVGSDSNSASQLKNAPHSKKLPAMKGVSRKSNQAELFPNSNITKPNYRESTKICVDVQSIRPVSTHPTLRTTEETLRYRELPRTTIERLSLFRYGAEVLATSPMLSEVTKTPSVNITAESRSQDLASCNSSQGYVGESSFSLEDVKRVSAGYNIYAAEEQLDTFETFDTSTLKVFPSPQLETCSVPFVLAHTHPKSQAVDFKKTRIRTLPVPNIPLTIKSLAQRTDEDNFDDDDDIADEDFEEILPISFQKLLQTKVTQASSSAVSAVTIRPSGSYQTQFEDDYFDIDETDEIELVKLLEGNVAKAKSNTSYVTYKASKKQQSSLQSPPPSSPILTNTLSGQSGPPPLATDLDPEIVDGRRWSTPIVSPAGRGKKLSSAASKVTLCSDPPNSVPWINDDTDFLPLAPFARPEFPIRARERSPILGVSSSVILRTCFRIGEALRSSSLCVADRQDAIIELFARVTYSAREEGTTKQHFHFADLFNDRPPNPKGLLDNYEIHALQETESRKLLGVESPGQMVRCLGRMKRERQGKNWMMDIINIRPTDWEEVRWTKKIAGTGMMKS